MQRLGIGFTGDLRTMEIARYARLAEELEYESFWIAEDYYLRDAVSILAFLSQATRKIKLGTGIISAYTRPPVVIAQTIATLDEMSKGRAILGIGTGVKPLIEKMGIQFQKPLSVMRESVSIIRRLMAGEQVDHRGLRFSIHDIKLGVNPYTLGRLMPIRRYVPIYIGAIGPKMLQLAGEIGDGVLMTSGLSPKQIALSVQNVKTGAAKSGRDSSKVDIACYIPSCISYRGKIDSLATKAYLAHVLAHSSERSLSLDGFDLRDVVSIRQAVDKGDSRMAADLVTDEMLDIYTASGTAERIRERIREYRSSGVTLPIICPTGSQIKRIIEICTKLSAF